MALNLKSIAHYGTTITLIGAATAGIAFGSPLVGSIVGGILTNLASSQLDPEVEKIKELLSKSNPSELNHDIEKTIIEALEWTIKNLSYLYEPYCSEKAQQNQLKEIEKMLLAQIAEVDKNGILKDDKIIKQIDGFENTDTLMQDFIKDLEKQPAINNQKPFPKFFEENFLKNFQLCFGELLKKPDNQPALIAYNRNISKQILRNLQNHHQELAEIKKGNTELKAILEKLAQTPQQKIEQEIVLPQIKIKLDQFLEPLHDKVQLLVDSNGKILTLAEAIKVEGEIQTRKIDDLSKKVEHNIRNKVIYAIILPVLAIIVAYLAYRYWQAKQPFIYTVQVQNTSKNAFLRYENPEVSFIYQGKTETQNAEKEVVFRNLPSSLRGDSAHIKVVSHGFYTLDTSIVLDGNHISLNLIRDDTYQYMIGLVKDAITGVGIAGANVMVLDISTTTDHNGNYKLKIPEEKQKTEHRLRVSKEGYKDWIKDEPIIKNTESIIQLEKL